MSGHLDGPPPGPPDPPYIPGDLGAPSAEEFARRRASPEPERNPYLAVSPHEIIQERADRLARCWDEGFAAGRAAATPDPPTERCPVCLARTASDHAPDCPYSGQSHPAAETMLPSSRFPDGHDELPYRCPNCVTTGAETCEHARTTPYQELKVRERYIGITPTGERLLNELDG